eukprot:1101747-Lingulodinium_polyedra.AAC.1
MLWPQRGEDGGRLVPPFLWVSLPWHRAAFRPRGDRPERHAEAGGSSGAANEEQSPSQSHGGR